MVTRQPIVSILGHVDHGKTTLLDRIRGTAVVEGEAGGITQHIGATEVPLEAITETCAPLMGDREFTLPGLLFIDTPGHRAFTTLRARGGALADLGVVVVDVQEGLMPQTKESLSILKRNNTPFIVAANKIDRIHGWNPNEDEPFVESFPQQSERVQDRFQDALYDVIGDLYDAGFPADRYDQIEDFTDTVAIVPMSALTGEGLADLLLVMTGLAQRFLEQEGGLEANPEGQGQATVLEVKEEKGFGATVDVILYDGKLNEGQDVVVGTTSKPKETSIRALLRPKAMDEIRDPSERFDTVDEVKAATGLKVSAPELDDVVPGAPLYGATPETVDEVVAEIESELEPDIDLDEHEGVFIKADTLGSLEALASEMAEAEIPIRMARVGDVSPRDVIEAATLDQREHQCILGFGVDVLAEAEEELTEHDIELITDDVVYNLIDAFEDYQHRLKSERQQQARSRIAFPGKLKTLPDHSFRMRKPAIVGVRVLKGRIRNGQRILREDGRVVGEIKSIREEDNPISEAEQGAEVAIAVADVQLGRQMDEGEIYYVDIPEGDFQQLSDFDLTLDEQEVKQEVAEIKREEHEPYWGM
ncbi:translation initiation factor IF-2 [Thermoplasmatales archaeon SW_10_69_26]|nr:MAG: translation initiation factor IF-2 [Thermoplasmatales archaeon SW_10_69_26]